MSSVPKPVELTPHDGGWISGPMAHPCVQCSAGYKLSEAEAYAAVKADGSGLLDAYYCPEGAVWHTILIRTLRHQGMP